MKTRFSTSNTSLAANIRQEHPSISFIIPAFNEELILGSTIEHIRAAMSAISWPYSIIVVDNGSTDHTASIAAAHGASVEVKRDCTIGALRNAGAAKSRGDLLVFLDADVTLTSEWVQKFPSVALQIAAGDQRIEGSHCAPPDSDNWILKYWFSSFASDPRNTHLGSAHMIMSADAFRRIGGFSEELRTGEDYEFCLRARRCGYSLVNDPALRVIHHGFPATIAQFVAREAWHGLGDLLTFRHWVGSRVGLATTVFLLIHFEMLVAAILGDPAFVAFGGAALLSLLFASSFAKFKHAGLIAVLINGGIFYFYYLGRALAVIKRITRNP